MSQPFNNSPTSWLTGTGRLVQGDPFTFNDEVYQKPGVKLPDGRVEYYIAIAFPKAHPDVTQFDPFYAALQQEAMRSKHIGTIQQQQWKDFAWKVLDGDAPENNTKPGFAGCWVVKCKNGFAPQVFDENGNAIPAQQGFPLGDYVRAVLSFKPNDAAPPQAGMYINFHMVQRVYYGERIVVGPDYGSLVRGQAAGMLPGASAMPVGGAVPAMQPQQGMAPGLPPAGAPGLPPQQGMAPGLPPQQPQAGMAPPAGGAPGLPPQQQGYAPPQGMAPQQGYAPPAGMQPQYAPQAGMAPAAGAMPPPQGMAPQQGYAPPAGMAPQQGYAPPAGGLPPQQGYAPQPGMAPAGHQYNQ